MKNNLFLLTITMLFNGMSLSQTVSSKEIPFESFSVQDPQFFTKISALKKVYNKSIDTHSGIVSFSLYKGNDNIGTNLENYDGILSIDNLYYPITLGEDYTIEVEDIAGSDKIPEIIIKSGCLIDIDGCGERLYIIRIVSKQCATITDFGEITYVASKNTNIRDEIEKGSKYSQELFLNDLKAQKKQGRFILSSLSINYDYLILRSYELSKKGFRQSTFIKKIKRAF